MEIDLNSSPSGSRSIHLIIPTHTTRHLDLCLVGVARQSRRPDTITVTSDVDVPAIEALLRREASRIGLEVRYVRRPSEGKERLAQVRNNAVRSLLDSGVNTGRLLFLDGDTYASEDCVEKHLRLGQGVDLVLPLRINLTEEQTRGLDPELLMSGKQRIEPTAEQLNQLDREHRRSQQHQTLRRLSLTKRHKPKLLGGHHSVDFEAYLRINGHDEEYHTWGTEDDDFARRIYATGGTSVVAIRDILVFHLYHPTRASCDWHDRENARRFKRRDLPVFCTHGVKSPLPQAPVRFDILTPSAEAAHEFAR